MKSPELPLVVSAAYADFPTAARAQLLELRALIFDIAQSNPAIGQIHETLKWGEPAYLTPTTKSGSTIRLASKRGAPDNCGIYLNCNTTLISDIKDIYPDAFTFQSNRAALFPANQPPDQDVLCHCLEMALTYHSQKYP